MMKCHGVENVQIIERAATRKARSPDPRKGCASEFALFLPGSVSSVGTLPPAVVELSRPGRSPPTPPPVKLPPLGWETVFNHCCSAREQPRKRTYSNGTRIILEST
jgi:hypothetical protein